MKIKRGFLILIGTFMWAHSWAQQVELITTDEERNSYQNKSYLVVKSITFKPGFTVSAATHGTWYARTHPAAIPPTSPSQDQNFVKSEGVLVSGVTTEAAVRVLPVTDRMIGYSYSDGVGHGLQSISVGSSPTLRDYVQPAAYDTYGRSTGSFLPYAASGGVGGSYRATGLTDQVSFYNSPPAKVQQDARAHSDVSYEASPLSRTTTMKALGNAWANEPVTSSMKFNVNDSDGTIEEYEVRNWTISSGLPVCSSTVPMVAGMLLISETVNEEGATSRSYTDFQGRLVMKESQTTQSRWSQTYYLYNDYGNVMFIIPPAAVSTSNPDDTFANKYFFRYQYDEHQRKIGSKAPGAGWIYTVYDRWDRPVLTQDGNQRTKSPDEWTFVKYDCFNRAVMTGTYGNDAVQSSLATTVGSQTGRFEVHNSSATGYSLDQSFPTNASESQLLSVTYYDNYSFASNNGWDAEGNSYAFVSESGYAGSPFTYNNEIKGKQTGVKVRILNSSTWLNSVTYYDDRYRAIQSISENQFGKLERVTSEYDFSGKVLKTRRVHNNVLPQTITIEERFTYDHSGRVLNSYHKVNSQPEVLLMSCQYNELGQLVDKKIHSTDGGSTWLQSVDYRYHIRGWLKEVDKVVDSGEPVDYFGLELAYEDSQSGNSPRHDGSVTGARWSHDLSSEERVYNYTYDNGILTSAAYKVDNAPLSGAEAGVYNESGLTYDLNGNITGLTRSGPGTPLNTATTIDNLSYTYESGGGNKLTGVGESPQVSKGFVDGNTSGDDYTYDDNGNLTRDRNKGIKTSADGVGIIYNLLNLPERINFSSNGDYILYTYDASGVKLSETYYNSGNQKLSQRDYVGEFVYENGSPQLIFHGEGRLVGASNENLITNISTREANSLTGYSTNGSVSLSIHSGGTPVQTYVKAICSTTGGTPGVFPINGYTTVTAGSTYTFKVLGYQSVGSNAKLYVAGPSGDLKWPGTPLEVGAANEGWVSVSFTVPSGVTQVRLGVLWDGGVNGNTFYINRVALYKSEWEHQYFLTDHLGSPRVVLQTAPSTLTYTATMESSNYADESARFLNLNPSREISGISAANATPGGSQYYLMNSSNRVGPGRSFRVLPGDVIDANVMAYYPTGGTYSKTGIAAMIAAVQGALTGGFAGSIESVVSAAYNDPNQLAALALSPDMGSGRPSAFINYILFDETYTPLEAKSQPVGTTGGALHQVTLPTINVTQTGYVYIYLSYDNEAGGSEVYFDEFNITYREGPVAQINSYYPFGMAALSWRRVGEYENEYLYQAKEYNELTGLHDFHARQYDPAVARWFVTDPKAQFANPYLAMGNNPVSNIDPDGEWVAQAIGAIAGGYAGWQMADAVGATGWRKFGYVLGGAAVGAISATIGVQVAAASILPNTAGIVAASFTNSIGMSALAGGNRDLTISVGYASYNFDQKELGYLGKPGNSVIDNVGYTLGGLGNLQDVFSAFAPGDYQYQYETEKGQNVGHGNVREVVKDASGNPVVDASGNIQADVKISVANLNTITTKHGGPLGALEYAWKANFSKYSGGPEYWLAVPEQGWPRIPLHGNSDIMNKMAQHLRAGRGLLNLGPTRFGVNYGCVSYAARSLWYTGIPTIPIVNWLGPRVLWMQLAARQAGIYASPYLTDLD